MKKILLSLTVISAFASLALVASAAVQRVPGPWDMTGTYVIDFTLGGGGVYAHTMNITSMDLATGAFSGTGFYNADPSYTWNVTGNVSDSSLSFTIVYTGSGAGYTVNATGTIAPDGTLSGNATGPGQTFTWVSTSGAATRFEGNHGQYVSSQTDKNAAAQSLIGMPVKSQK